MLGFLIFLGWAGIFGTPLIISAFNAKNTSQRRWWLNALWAIGGGVLIIALLSIFHIWTTALWFQELGQVSRFWTVFWAQWQYFLIGTAIFAAFIGLNIKATTLGLNKETRANLKWLTRIMYFVGLIVSLGFGAAMSGFWKSFLMYQHQVPFGILDPIFHRDAAFYVFSLPVMAFWRDFSIVAIIASIVLIGITYGIQHSVYFDSGNDSWDDRRRNTNKDRLGSQTIYRWITHFSAQLALLMGALMFATKIGIWNLLFSTRGAVFGAGYTDVNVQIGANQFFFWTLLIAAIIFIVSVVVRNLRSTIITAIIAAALCLGTYLIGMEIIPAWTQHFSVTPNELTKEQQYIAHDIAFTRQAYDLTDSTVTQSMFEVNKQIDPSVWQTDSNTLRNIRVWDWRVLQSNAIQKQAFRLYYTFADIDVVRYAINGMPKQMMSAARELEQDRLTDQAKTWQNLHLVYTHGFGACANAVNAIAPGGMPDYILKDIPPQSNFTELHIGQPRIYYGERTTGYVYVNTLHPEFDYPDGDSNVTCTYDGPGGITIGSGWRKLAFTLRFDGIRLLTANEITPQSKIMFDRDLNTRVTTLAPFLEYDSDPYQVIAMDSIWFIWDAYTTTNHYPYSKPLNGLNYIRNSVKVVMNTYTGKVDFYVFSPEKDPLIQVYMKMFPGFFKSASAMPAALRQHIRYPEDMLRIQGTMYGNYHMSDPAVFYNKEDAWQITKESSHGTVQDMLPYYVVIRIPGESKEEFVQILPFTPFTTDPKNPRNNMVAWLAARCDGDHYGEIILYKFSKDELTNGPMQVGAIIQQDENFSRDMTLWNQQGSKVNLGNLLVLPLSNHRLIYFQPLYLQAENSPMPELKRVMVVFNGKLGYGTTFEDALNQIIESSWATTPISPTTSTKPAKATSATNDIRPEIHEAAQHFEAYRRLTAEGKYAEAGHELDALGRILGSFK